MDAGPRIVGIGGTTRPGSTTNRALGVALEAAERAGARTTLFGGEFLARLPHYAPESRARTPEALELLAAVRESHGVVLASPGYHGGISGLVKNAVDLLEDLRDDDHVYLDSKPVGCIVTGHGAQACVTTLAALRAVVHSLRGWPTPLGVTLNTAAPIFDGDGRCIDAAANERLTIMARQLVEFRPPRPPGRDER